LTIVRLRYYIFNNKKTAAKLNLMLFFLRPAARNAGDRDIAAAAKSGITGVRVFFMYLF
jgi:hypothetical protein